MREFRCQECNRLLAKVEGPAKVEIKCPRCKAMNFYSEETFITIETVESRKDKCIDPDIAEA